jgi:uncharacterized cupredoxin-like copper-binding protein
MIEARLGAVLAIALSWTPFSLIAQTVAEQVVTITLQDPSGDSSVSGMVMKTDAPTVKAGRLTLQALNQSKELVHEVLVVPAPRAGKELPYDAKKDMIIEKRVLSLGEISDLKPGARGKLTLNLTPGTYLLLCNQPGHYKAGMSASLVVQK